MTNEIPPPASGQRPDPLDDILDGTLVERPPKRRGWSWQKHQEQFTADEKEREAYNQNSLDNFLGAPILMYLVAFTDPSAELVTLAYFTWLVAALLWTPWIVYRVAGRRGGDPRRASAILAYGLVLWPFTPLLWTFGGRTGLLVGFPLLYAWNGAAMLFAGRTKPPQRTPESYANLITGGGAVYLLLALCWGGLGVGAYNLGLGFFGFLVPALIGLWMAASGVKLLSNPGGRAAPAAPSPASFSPPAPSPDQRPSRPPDDRL